MAAGRVRSAVFAAALLLPVGTAPAVAGPAPDIDSLIDDSGPLPAQPGDPRPDLVFSTDTGLVCAFGHAKITYSVSCRGDLPGAPPGTRSVMLPIVYLQGSGPGFYSPQDLVAHTQQPGTPTTTLGTGHKIVFWNYSATEKLACGIPPGAAMSCVLDAPHEIGPRTEPPVTHGFVIAAPQSSVF